MEKHHASAAIVGVVVVVVLMVALTPFLVTREERVGLAYSLQSGEAFAVERVVDGSQVTLNILHDDTLIDSNEIIIIAEQVPSDVTFVDGSMNVAPFISDDTTALWLFALSPPQALGETTVDDGLPNTITYEMSAASTGEFAGRWGFESGAEDAFVGDAGESPAEGEVTLQDVLTAIQEYRDGQRDILSVLNVIQQYREGN